MAAIGGIMVPDVCDAGNHANYFTIFPHGMGIKRFPKFIVKPISPQPNSTTTLFIKWIWGNTLLLATLIYQRQLT